jgi:hypothetical protein
MLLPSCAAPPGSAQPCDQPTGDPSADDDDAADACVDAPRGVACSKSGVRTPRALAGVAGTAWRGVAPGGSAGRRGVAP